MTTLRSGSFGPRDVKPPAPSDSRPSRPHIIQIFINVSREVNLKGVFLGCKFGIPALLRAGGGSIINTASFVAKLGAATPQVAYTASKGGVLSMTKELAVIHARQGIRVNALCPGPLRTDLLDKFLDTEEKRQRRYLSSLFMCGIVIFPIDWCTSQWEDSERRRKSLMLPCFLQVTKVLSLLAQSSWWMVALLPLMLPQCKPVNMM